MRHLFAYLTDQLQHVSVDDRLPRFRLAVPSLAGHPACAGGASRYSGRLHHHPGLVLDGPSLLGHGVVLPGRPENSLLRIVLILRDPRHTASPVRPRASALRIRRTPGDGLSACRTMGRRHRVPDGRAQHVMDDGLDLRVWPRPGYLVVSGTVVAHEQGGRRVYPVGGTVRIVGYHLRYVLAAVQAPEKLAPVQTGGFCVRLELRQGARPAQSTPIPDPVR